MEFRLFRYQQKAEAGLMALFQEGAFDELKALVEGMEDWEPDPEEPNPAFIVPFKGRYLVFTRAKKDPSILVLADIEPEPRR